ncbi:MAG: C40 family peptidase [Paramuribaculum sp.]|nr:C40 family peptidase [Paramuribaculum sp.]
MTLHRIILQLAFAALAGFLVPASASERENDSVTEDLFCAEAKNSDDVMMPSLEEMLGEPIDDFAEVDDLSALLDEMIDFSKSFIGTRYRLGATGPKAFDCSGFTGYVFRNFGFNLMRDSRSQGTQGTRVDITEAQPGDLIFFSGRRSGRNIGHVGIVVEAADSNGNLKFIHASTSKGVRIDSYPQESYYAKRFVGIRRIIGEPGAEVASN